jgi:2-(1,2-epoxy-1,2-dihydrophenyl)acetyl-CoA isomerase
MSKPVLLEKREHIATITLNRPERANVLDRETFCALSDVIADVAGDHSLRAVLLQGTGKHFCAGGDIADFAAAGKDLPPFLDRHIPPLHAAMHTLASLPVPVVSAVNGPIGGGGIGLALCADIVLAAESMKLRGGYSAIGLTPDVGSSWFLTRLVGPMRAKQIFFSNTPLTAHQCLAWGVVSEVYADKGLSTAARTLVENLARGATGALGRIKHLVDGAGQRSIQEQLDLEHRFMVEAGATAHAAEGVAAFVEKRAAKFHDDAPQP